MWASGFAWKTIFGKAIEGKENKNIAIKRERAQPRQLIEASYCCCCWSVIALPFLWSNQYLANKVQYFRVEISILNSYTYRHTFSISACLSPIHCKPSISFMRKWHFHSMWCLRSAFNGVHCWMRECVIAGNVCRLFPYTYVRIFYSIWSSFQMYVLQENEEENSLQFFSHSHSHHIHTALQYILVDGARVLLSVLLLHLHFLPLLHLVVAIKH